jgi:hypothetical protein
MWSDLQPHGHPFFAACHQCVGVFTLPAKCRAGAAELHGADQRRFARFIVADDNGQAVWSFILENYVLETPEVLNIET